MSNSSGLHTLIELATDRRDSAASALGRLRAEQRSEREQYNALCSYRREYRERMDRLMINGLNPVKLENYRRFLASLDRAIARQQENLSESEHRVDGGKRVWQQEHRQLRSYDVLAERRQEARQRVEARREQSAMDEHAQRLGRSSGG